jgi:hypothetical protein
MEMVTVDIRNFFVSPSEFPHLSGMNKFDI